MTTAAETGEFLFQSHTSQQEPSLSLAHETTPHQMRVLAVAEEGGSEAMTY